MIDAAGFFFGVTDLRAGRFDALELRRVWVWKPLSTWKQNKASCSVIGATSRGGRRCAGLTLFFCIVIFSFVFGRYVGTAVAIPHWCERIRRSLCLDRETLKPFVDLLLDPIN
ncbi:hypothetical protein [Tunturiibacter gelidiferens]|uniref:hypothetical protein n=1 Tax=Tunturiibacter gelidiferens TaxID=3069689 RepID=UPI003D9BF9EF